MIGGKCQEVPIVSEIRFVSEGHHESAILHFNYVGIRPDNIPAPPVPAVLPGEWISACPRASLVIGVALINRVFAASSKKTDQAAFVRPTC